MNRFRKLCVASVWLTLCYVVPAFADEVPPDYEPPVVCLGAIHPAVSDESEFYHAPEKQSLSKRVISKHPVAYQRANTTRKFCNKWVVPAVNLAGGFFNLKRAL